MNNVINDNALALAIQILFKHVPTIDISNLEIKAEFDPNQQGVTIDKVGNIVSIHYAKKHQFFEGIGYLLTHLSMHSFCHQIIHQNPHLGFMLDAARDAVPKLETLKQYVIYLALFGYDYFEIYVEDVLEVIDEPMFGYMRGKYTQKELNELDDFATLFGIEMVPCIQTLAHLERIFMHEPYGVIHDIDDILLVGHDRTYQLIDNILRTTRACFKSNRINIGMDEAWHLGVGKYLDQNGYQTRIEIMGKHLAKVLELTRKYGYQTSMWADMFFHLTGSNYHQDGIEISRNIKALVPPDLTLIYWDYYRTDLEGYLAKFEAVKSLTNNYSYAGGAWKWMGFSPNNQFTYRSMAEAIKAFTEYKTNDFLVTGWGDDGGEASHFSILGPLAWISSKLTSDKDTLSHKDLVLKWITGYTLDELDQLERPNLLNDSKNYLPHNPSKYLLYEDVLMGSTYYKVSRNYKNRYASHSKALKSLSKRNVPFSYLFETLYHLSKVLEVKSTLTIEIYEAYKAKNTHQMTKCIHTLSVVIKRVESLFKHFEIQWHKESKPQGFEVHTHRFGGLLLRLKSVRKLLTDWLLQPNSLIDVLEEKSDYIEPTDEYAGTISHNYVLKYITYAKP